MKVVVGADGLITRITKLMDPAQAYGEYIGATLIGASAAEPLAAALHATWRRDPSLYYEDGFQELAYRGGAIAIAPIGDVEWVEVDNHDDLRRAREIAARCLYSCDRSIPVVSRLAAGAVNVVFAIAHGDRGGIVNPKLAVQRKGRQCQQENS